MSVYLAPDVIVKRLLTPDIVLAVLVRMTAFGDA